MKILDHYKMIDAFIAAQDFPDPCSRCTGAYCCVQPVTVGLREAEAIAEHTPPGTLDRIERWKATGVADQQWDLLTRQGEPGSQERGIAVGKRGIQCPLLIDGRCSIYAVRPATCRAFVPIVTDPDDCRKWMIGEGDIRVVSGAYIRNIAGPVEIGRIGLLPLALEYAILLARGEREPLQEPEK